MCLYYNCFSISSFSKTFAVAHNILKPLELTRPYLHCSTPCPSTSSEAKKTKPKAIDTMGITGLLPMLKKASKNTHIKNYRGYSAAVDGLGWLHKGAFGCAVKLGLGEPTDAYVNFCMKYVNLLLQNGIRPVIVFDGRSLISKEPTNKKRRESRKANRKKALQLVRKGDKKAAWEYFVKSIEITHEMIYAWITVLRQKHIDYIVAPFEADAQLAYLSRQGIVDLVITEDSDLTIFGCPQILFKLKMDGSCVIFNRSKIHSCLGVDAVKFQFEKFRQMCILSGCDYLDSLPGIGLVRARKVVDMMTTPDIVQAIKSIPTLLKLSIEVSDEYTDDFLKAENAFLYQLVFDPISRKIVPLNPYLMNVDPKNMPYAGTYDLDNKTAFEMAIGNINTKTLEVIDDKFNIDKDKGYAGKATSIWSKKYVIPPTKNPIKDLKETTKHSSVKGLKATVSIKDLKIKKRPLAVDEDRADADNPLEAELLAAMYAEDESGNTIKIEGKDTNGILNSEITPKIEGQQSKSKRVKIMTPTSPSRPSLRDSDTYNMRTTRSIFVDAPEASSKRKVSNDKHEEFEVTENSPNKNLRKKTNPFTKSPDIGRRAREKIRGILDVTTSPMKSSYFSNRNEIDEKTINSSRYLELVRVGDDHKNHTKTVDPICLVEKNYIYDMDSKLIVKSKYFKPQTEIIGSKENAIQFCEGDGEEMGSPHNAVKLSDSQFSIYSIDKDSFKNSESQNLKDFLDVESQNLKEEFLNSQNPIEVEADCIQPLAVKPEAILKDDSDSDEIEVLQVHSEYFSGHRHDQQKDKNASQSDKPRYPTQGLGKSSSPASSQSKSLANKGKKAAGKSPVSVKKGNTGKLIGSCRQNGLKKISSKPISGQKSIKEMFSCKVKAKI